VTVVDIYCQECGCNVGLAGCYEHPLGLQIPVVADAVEEVDEDTP